MKAKRPRSRGRIPRTCVPRTRAPRPRVAKKQPRVTRRQRVRCAGYGCHRPVPPLALKYNDPWCSTRCARIAYGTWGTTWLTTEQSLSVRR